MLLPSFLAIMLCGTATLIPVSAVAFAEFKKLGIMNDAERQKNDQA